MKNILFFILLTTFAACSLSSEESQSIPYNSNLSTSSNWSLEAKAIFDKKERAIKLSHAGSTWLTSDRATTNFTLPIKAGKTYTISLKSKTDSPSLPLVEVSGSYYGNDGFISNSLGSIITNSKPNIWEESTVYIKVPNNSLINKFKIRIIDLPKKGINGNIWIKDISFKEGLHTTKIKPQKKSFDGVVTKVDKLGNISIYKNGKYVPFFPIGIYTNHKRRDWSIYKRQGFNTAMWCDSASSIKKAKDAGLYASMQLIQYIMPVDPRWIPQEHNRKIAHLKRTLQQIKNQGLSSNLLFYYIDNEFYHINKNFTDIVDIVIEQDKDKSGKRMHPIYMLNGTYTMARKYNKWIDFTGTYVAEDMYDTDRTEAFTILNETENQIQPTVIAQINRGVGLNFRPILFGAIAKGARGMGFWKDGASVGDITDRAWWNELPKIVKEIKEMMPLIRSDQHTSWSITCSDNSIIYGTRTVNGIGYIIVTNPTRKDKKINLSIKNLPYKPNYANDYFSKQQISTIKNDNFSLTIPKHGSKVIKLAK